MAEEPGGHDLLWCVYVYAEGCGSGSRKQCYQELNYNGKRRRLCSLPPALTRKLCVVGSTCLVGSRASNTQVFGGHGAESVGLRGAGLVLRDVLQLPAGVHLPVRGGEACVAGDTRPCFYRQPVDLYE